MARIYELTKSHRGAVQCGKCGRNIFAGEKYYKATPYKQSPVIRCTQCGIMAYETSGSSYIRSAGSIKFEWQKKYKIDEDIIDYIIDDVEDLKENVEDNLNNMPEQLQEDSILQDRLDSLEDCLSELESIDISEYNSDDKISIIEDINAALNNILLK